MAQNSSGEKTEEATQKRKDDERKKGNVSISQEAVTVATMLVSFAVLRAFGTYIYSNLQISMRQFIGLGATMDTVTVESVNKLFIHGCIIFAIGTMPVALGCSIAAIAFTLAQTRGLFSAKGFAFKANRMSPMNAIRNLFSMRGLMELIKSILKIVLLSVVVWNVLSGWVTQLPKLMNMQVGQAFANICDTSFSMAMQVSLLFVALAAADFFFQRFDYNKKLRMTKQEVKEEYKETEGDPQIKGAIRDRQQAMARKRMMQNVPNADVVIRNPTHVAVAIRYDPKKSKAPVVVAKGLDSLALRIVAVAEENGVYITENRPLARALYAAVDIDQEIPEKYYQTVAEVLAFVYKLKKRDL